MNFLLDVNASGAVAIWLIQLGHGVVEVGQKDPRMSDNEILSWAVRERRIIVTTDNDFEEMIWRQGKPHCGVLRFENLPRSERIALLHDVLDCHSLDSRQ
jgi:predicted nuclease of predicted toxin-antitoxin system